METTMENLTIESRNTSDNTPKESEKVLECVNAVSDSSDAQEDSNATTDAQEVSNATTDAQEDSNATTDAQEDSNATTDAQPDVESETRVSQDSEEEAIVLDTVDITPEQSGGVMKQVVQAGKGDETPGFGDRVFVHYTGWILNKDKPVMFDSNRKEDKPCEFNLGRGMVIKGWDLGVATMKKGEVAMFIIQPSYAYGDMGNPPTIPPHSTLLFEVELHDWKLDDLSPKKDGNILRKVIEKGEGTTGPNDGSLVKVKLIGTYEDKVFEDCEKEFLLGEGCQENIIEGIELALPRFHLNEKSILYIKSKYGFEKGSSDFNIPPDATVMYEVTLMSFEKTKEVWEMNTDEKYERAKISKEKGVSYLKAGNYKVALKQFRWVLLCLENEPGVAPESVQPRQELLLASYLNISLCLLKMENFVDAVKFCDKALRIEQENEKALFRRAQARMQINDCEEALQDFKTVYELYPDNKSAAKYIVLCEEKIKKQNLKDKSVYNQMFEKFKKKDEERMKHIKTETGVWEEEEAQEKREKFMTETERMIEMNNSLLRDANIIELSNTAC